jgi:hypothetical protein
MAIKTALTIAGSYLAIAQGLTLILTQTMTALILGVATPFLVLGGCAAYVLERETRPELPPRQTEPRIIDVPPRRFRKAAWWCLLLGLNPTITGNNRTDVVQSLASGTKSFVGPVDDPFFVDR